MCWASFHGETYYHIKCRNHSSTGVPTVSEINIYPTVHHFLSWKTRNDLYLKEWFLFPTCTHWVKLRSCTNSIHFKQLVMKTIIVLAMIIISLVGCRTGKDIQVEFVMATLIKIDTVQRFTEYEKVLTWEDTDKIRYRCYLPMKKRVAVGMEMLVMRRR